MRGFTPSVGVGDNCGIHNRLPEQPASLLLAHTLQRADLDLKIEGPRPAVRDAFSVEAI